MSLGWMLLCGLALLLLLGVYLFRRTSRQVRDCPLPPPVQSYELPHHRSGRRAYEGERSIDVAKSAPLSSRHEMAIDTTSWAPQLSAKLTAPTRESEPQPSTIQNVSAKDECMFDGADATKATMRITRVGDVFKLVPMSLDPVGPDVPTRGLIIRAEPLEKILSGIKTLELRKKSSKARGPIALIQKGSGKIVGVATLGGCVGPMTFTDFAGRVHEHGVEPQRLRQVFDDGYVVGWKLSEIRRLRMPVSYIHKPGAVTWVTLDEADRAALHAAMVAA